MFAIIAILIGTVHGHGVSETSTDIQESLSTSLLQVELSVKKGELANESAMTALVTKSESMVNESKASVSKSPRQKKNGLVLPELGYLACTSGCKSCDEQTNYDCVKSCIIDETTAWLRGGGKLIDTASVYKTQANVGSAVEVSGLKREDYLLSTKCPGAIGWQATFQCVDDALQMMGQLNNSGVQYLDVLFMHYAGKFPAECRFSRTGNCTGAPVTLQVPATKAERQDTWRAMVSMKELGVLKYLGLATYTKIWEVKEILEVAPVDIFQMVWSPYDHDHDLRNFAESNGMLVQSWVPLSDIVMISEEPIIQFAAIAHNVSATQVVVRWILDTGVHAVVEMHSEDLLGVMQFKLTDAETRMISELSNSPKAIAKRNAVLKV